MARPVGRSPELRDRILSAAMGCFETHGYEATTMAMVVQASEVARATVYGHFASKEALAEAAARVQLDALLRAAPAELGARSLAACLAGFNRRSVAWLRRNSAVAEVYMRHIQSQGDYSGQPAGDQPSLRRSLRALFAQAGAAGDGLHEPDTELLADGYALLWFNLCMQWLASRDDALLQRRLDALVRLYAPEGRA